MAEIAYTTEVVRQVTRQNERTGEWVDHYELAVDAAGVVGLRVYVPVAYAHDAAHVRALVERQLRGVAATHGLSGTIEV